MASKETRSLGISIICWSVFGANISLMFLLFVLPVPQKSFFLQQALSLLATVAVYPQDFYQYYLSGQPFAQISWMLIMMLSAVGVRRLHQVSRMLFIVLNIIHIVILTFIVLSKFPQGYEVFVRYFFKLYFNLVASGTYIGFLTIAEVREKFRSQVTMASVDLAFKRLRARAPAAIQPEGHFNLGLAYRRLGRLDDAVDELSTAVELSPQRHKYRYELGATLFQLKQYEAAIPQLKQAADLDPLDITCYFYLSQAYLKVGCSREAVKVLRRATHARPEDGKIYYELGLALQQTQSVQAAAKAFRQAEVFGFRDPNLYFQLGRVLSEDIEEQDAARQAFLTVLRQQPDNSLAAYFLGCIAVKTARYKEAIRYLKQALEAAPEDVQAHYQLGFAYAMIRDADSARREQARLKELDSDLAQNLQLVIDSGEG